MNLPRISSSVLVLALLLAINTLLGGCSRKAAVAIDTGVFSSAPPDISEKWKAAAEQASQRNYLAVATNLADIFSRTQQLTSAQTEALNQAWLQLGNQAFEAANKGDKTATEAVIKMREYGIGDQRPRR